ncbi:MAG: agmatinase family protein [Fimbriimonadaceae bacterium]|nr:agmatinase family protein [Fimbriimonadaceae bacterium]
MSLHQDPHWPRASEWLADGGREVGSLGVLGVPLNRSITPGACDEGPSAIRAALVRCSTYDLERGYDVRDVAVRDLGDLTLQAEDAEAEHARIEAAVRLAAEAHDRVVVFGGDNGLTRPALRGAAEASGVPLASIGLLTLDAHLDLRTLEGGPINGNPIRGLLEDGLPGANIVQIGLQSFANSAAYRAVAMEAGIASVTMGQARRRGLATVVKEALDRLAASFEAIYVDLDLDAMDRAFAPGCPGSRPGGFLPWEMREAAFVCGAHPKVRWLDLVELDPSTDIGQTTALAAAMCFLEFASGYRSAL